jgi:DNA-binding transcriptional MerR regulator
MTLHEFLEMTKLPERTLRHYTQHGLLPQPRWDAGEDGYGERHLMRVHAIFRLQGQGVRQLRDIAARLDAMSEEELRRFASEDDDDRRDEGLAAASVAAPGGAPAPTSIAPAAAGGGASAPTRVMPAPASGGASAPTSTMPAPASGARPGREEWTHLTLRPGLVLTIRRGTSDEVHALVRAILSLCGIDASVD